MNGTLKADKQQIEWRRNQTLELAARGKSQREISIILQVSEGTTSIDMKWIRQQAQKAIEQHIQAELPLEHQKAMSGLHQVLKMAWDLSVQEQDTRNKLLSLTLVNDCYKLIMELSSDASIIKEAIAFVNKNQNKNKDKNKNTSKPSLQEEGQQTQTQDKKDFFLSQTTQLTEFIQHQGEASEVEEDNESEEEEEEEEEQEVS